MKRLVCLLLVVSIAYAGCADKKQGKVAVVASKTGWETPGDWQSNEVLRNRIVVLERQLTKARKTQRPGFMLDRLDALEADVLKKISELGYAVTSKRTALDSAEVAIEAQRVTIEVLQKLCRLYEDVLGSQKETIELLKKICRLYEEEVYGF